jgi:hypothetical protein
MPDENMWRFLDPLEVRNVRTDRVAEQVRVVPADGTFTVTAGTWIQLDAPVVRVTWGVDLFEFPPVFPGPPVIAIIPDEVE